MSDPARRPLLLVAARHEELAPLTRRAAGRRPARHGVVLRGRLGMSDVLLLVAGEGERAAAEALAPVLSAAPVAAVVGLGVAGGLSPGLAPGDLFLAAELRAPDGRRLHPPAGWLERAHAATGAPAATVVGSHRLLATPAAKRAAWDAAGRPSPALVDLESAAFAAAAESRGLPWLVARAVSDPAETPLPLDLDACRDASGATRRRLVGRAALARPWTLPALLRLALRVRRSARRLADLVAALPPGG